ncbi:pectinesterase family protein [Uliginosibacterium sp. H3]|uniref:Pectinesterase n=1 Tax=Uliginosibacterium silvisoli TaxID=3114758 RepID=A0ABU6K0C5_9RHOO|nr:pectinesterase family protein [Uliginosibacterium sp. H3]
MFRKILTGSAMALLAGSAFAATDAPSGYTKCVQLGSTCAMSGTHQAAIGKSGVFAYATFTGSFACTLANFPGAPSNSSWCSYDPAASSASSSAASSVAASSVSSSKSSSSSSSVVSSSSSSVAASSVASSKSSSANASSVPSTSSRPQLSSTSAANNTIAKYLGSWDPTAGVGNVSSFTAKYTVAADGTGTHKTVQAAISAAVSNGGSSRIYIAVKAGTYREVVCVPAAAPPITLYSTTADASKTVIVYNNANPKPKSSGTAANPCSPNASATTYGTGGSTTFSAFSQGFQAKNLTFSNDYVEDTYSSSNQSAVALTAQGDQQLYENVRVLGNQDSLLTNTSAVGTVAHHYFKSSYVEGDTDFIFGRGTAVFDGCEIRYLTTRKSNGVILAPSTAASNSYGILIINSTLTQSGSASNSVSLGRAWDESVGSLSNYVNGTSPNGQAVIRDSALGGHIVKTAPWGASTVSRPFCSSNCTNSANRFYEYNNSGSGNGG